MLFGIVPSGGGGELKLGVGGCSIGVGGGGDDSIAIADDGLEGVAFLSGEIASEDAEAIAWVDVDDSQGTQEKNLLFSRI